MAFSISNFTGNDDIDITSQMGPFSVAEYKRDLSVTPYTAMNEFFSAQMMIRRRQLICDIAKSNGGVTLQSGAMQWMMGNVKLTTGIKGVGDFLKKTIRGAASNESTVKPEYTGAGLVVTEATYKHLILLDTAEWDNSIVLDDGLFLACEASLEHRLVARSTFSSAVAGGEGLFNMGLYGAGIVCLESLCPRQEMIDIHLKDDIIKIDGALAVAWSSSLKFTVERSGKSLTGSAVSGEGLVNVYRGTGRLLMTPVAPQAKMIR